MKEHTNKKVIVIVNMPCSSGTFYTSFISKSLSEDPWIIDETSPNTPNSYGLKAFSVSVPLLKECLRGRVAYQEWEHCYKTQIETILLHWNKAGSSLLTFRAHAWTDATGKYKKTLGQILNDIGISFDVIYTHRNPIDTWLGIASSFPESIPDQDLTGFSRIYMKSIKQWQELTNKGQLIHIQTEDICRDPQGSLSKLANKLSIGPESVCLARISPDELGSGASGRKFIRPVIPKRRPYSTRMEKEATNSPDFQGLQSTLGYSLGIGSNSLKRRLAAIFHATYQPFLRFEVRPGLKLVVLASKLKLSIAFY